MKICGGWGGIRAPKFRNSAPYCNHGAVCGLGRRRLNKGRNEVDTDVENLKQKCDDRKGVGEVVSVHTMEDGCTAPLILNLLGAGIIFF